MNRWQCDHPGCDRECVGVGGAIGLRAIGWWFTYAGPVYCPQHRPDAVPCVETELHDACQLCAAEQEAKRWQKSMAAELGGFPIELGV
jgi:hypothetical protein